MFREIGHRVERLIRISIGPLKLSGLGEGSVRELEPDEGAVSKR